MSLMLYAAPFFLATVFLEFLLTRRSTQPILGYARPDTFASLAMGVGNLALTLLVKGLHVALFAWLYQFRLFTIEPAWWTWALVFVVEDFCYYWFHRAHHEVRFLWAAHVNHHSSRRYNLSTALRQSWTTPFTAPIFWAPLPLLGFPVEMILVAQAVSLLYQYWIHTELIDRLGPLELVMNTPSHHRVHHGKNPRYLDRNHGGIFIVWDRLFGTFEREDENEKVVYGLTRDIDTYHPVKIAFHEWVAMLRDTRKAKSLRGVLGTWLMPPGWREDGTGKTSNDLRRQAEVS